MCLVMLLLSEGRIRDCEREMAKKEADCVCSSAGLGEDEYTPGSIQHTLALFI